MNRRHSLRYYQHATANAIYPGDRREIERHLAKTDLFYLLVYVLGRKDVNREWIYERCREVEKQPDGYLDLWPRGFYKDLADDTPILTHNRGWVVHGDLKIGDEVYDDCGQPRRVVALSKRYTDAECYRLTFSDGDEIVAGGGHLWRVRRKKRIRVGDWHKNARETLWEEELIPTCALPDRADVGVLSEAISGSYKKLPIDPYLLGAWLGDGHSKHPKITSGLADADEMEHLLRSRGEKIRRVIYPSRSDVVYFAIGDGKRGNRKSSEFTNNLRRLGVYGKHPTIRGLGLIGGKHIPEIYKRASIEQRMMLLRGLMDTDGSCSDRGQATFCTSNLQLAEDVFELAIGLALKPHLYNVVQKTGDFVGYKSYHVGFQAHKDRVPFCLSRKIARAIEPTAHRNCRDVVKIDRIESVPTRCIQVDGGIYLAGKHLIPTHNSTVITFGLTIQDILRDPEITVGIFSFSRPIAKAFLRQIKREFESNERLRLLFDDVLWENPERDAPSWSEDSGIIIKRKTNPKEATIESWGLVDGQPTSRHFRLMVYDDVVTRDSVTNPEMIKKVTEAWEISRNLTVPGGKTRTIGTRWHWNDTYRQIIERGAAIERRHTATIDGTADGEPVLLSREELAKKRREMGVHVFNAQMLLDPTADRTQGFRDDWLRFYDGGGDFTGMNKYLLVDAASEKKKSSDYTSMVVLGLSSDNNFYLLDALRDRLSLRERGDAVFSLHRRWRPIGVGYEKYGMMADVEYIRERQHHENYHFDITELGGQIAKNDRIKRMVPIFEANRFLLPMTLFKTNYEKLVVDLVQDFIEQEYKPFPVGIHDDMFDAISRIEDMQPLIWPRPKHEEDRYARPRERNRRYSSWAA